MKNFSKGKTTSSQIYYEGSDGEIKPVSTKNLFPVGLLGGIGAFISPWKLNYEDIKTNAGNNLSYIGGDIRIDDESKLYDNDILTYSKVSFDSAEEPAFYYILLNIPQYIKSVVMINVDRYQEASYSNLHLYVHYIDGTVDLIKPVIKIYVLNELYMDILIYDIPKLERVAKLVIKSEVYDSTIGAYVGVRQSFECHGLYVFVNSYELQADMQNTVNNISENTYDLYKINSNGLNKIHRIVANDAICNIDITGADVSDFDNIVKGDLSSTTTLTNFSTEVDITLTFKVPINVSKIFIPIDVELVTGAKSGSLIHGETWYFYTATGSASLTDTTITLYSGFNVISVATPTGDTYRKVVIRLSSINDISAIHVYGIILAQEKETLPRNISQISGQSLTPRDWSNDFAYLEYLQYLYDSSNSLSAITALENINSTLKEYIINEVSLPINTVSNSPALLIASTAKPTAPQETDTITFPASDSQGNTLYGTSAIIKINKFAGYIELSFTNSDTASAHTAYVEVDIDGVQAATGSVSVPAATTAGPGSASLVLNIEQTDPADGTLNIDIYLWADVASVITLTDYTISMAVGTYSTSYDDVISVNRDGVQVIAASFANTDTSTYGWQVKSQVSGVRINYLQADDLYLSDLLPKVNIELEVVNQVDSKSVAYITGIYTAKKTS